MAVNFPSSPYVGEIYTYNGRSWEWNGTYWESYSYPSSSISGVTSVGFGDSVINGVVDNVLALKSFSGDGVSIIDDGVTLTISANTSPGGSVTSVSGGTGLSGNSTTGDVVLINTAPDQTVTISGGTGITTGGTYPNFTITNSAPDQTVTISGGTNIQIAGSYPNFGVNYTGNTGNINGGGTVNSIPKWTGATGLGDSLITDDGAMVTIPDLTVNTSFEFIPAEYYNKIDPYYNLVRLDGSSLVKPLNNEGFGGKADSISGDWFINISNDSDSRAIEIFYRLTSTDDNNFRSGKIIANWDRTYTNFYQTEYGPNYDLTSMTFIDPPQVVYGGTGTSIRVVINFDDVTDPANLLTARFKYILL